MAAVITTRLFLLLGKKVQLWHGGHHCLLCRLVLGKPVGGSMGLFGLMLVKDLRGFEGIYLTLYATPFTCLWKCVVNNQSCIIGCATIIFNVATKSHLFFGLT